MIKQRRVVVTGMGLRSPIGNSPSEFCEGLLSSKTGVRFMPEWEALEKLRVRVAGVCDGIDEKEIPRLYRRTMGRVGYLAALASMDAVKDSGIEESIITSSRTGVSFGSTAGSSQAMEDYLRPVFKNNSLKGLQSSTYLKFMSHTCAGNVAVMFQSKGPVIASSTACTSGSQGVGYGCDAIRIGRADVMICGGAEEMHFMDGVIFDILRATSTEFNDDPGKTPRPFDADRDGLVVAEGGGCLVLEEYEHARARGAHIYAEVAGWSTNCDGLHLTMPSNEGMYAVMSTALQDAELSPEKIDYINAHATATLAGDLAESQAVNKLFGTGTPISGLKGYMGHTLGAAGAIESIACIMMMNEGFLSPTRNLEKPDPELAPIGHIMGETRQAKVDTVMNNNFAFGGINTSLIFARI